MPITLTTLTLDNPGFESGDMAGWTASDASVAASSVNGDNSPHSGGYHAFAGTTTPTQFWQDKPVAAHAAAIDAGGVTLSGYGAWHATFGPQTDHGHLFAAFLDGVGATIATLTTADSHPDDWTLETLADAAVPAGARTIRLGVVNIRDEGTNNDNYWDDFVSPRLLVEMPAAGLGLSARLRLGLAAFKDPPFERVGEGPKTWARTAPDGETWACTAVAPPLPCDGADVAAGDDLALSDATRLAAVDGAGLKLIG
jgi:hypothetical protein